MFATTVARIVLLEAVRNRLGWVALIVVGIALGAAQFLSQVALTESARIQGALIAAILRATAVFIVATFVITSMVREANDKVNELLLSQPAPRSSYFLGKFAGYAGVACCVALGFSLPLALFAPGTQVGLWGLSLACELLIVTAVSLFCVISLTQVPPAFAATAGFYLLARSIEAMQVIAAAPVGASESWIDAAVKWIVDAIALVMPALDRMTLTSWLLEGPPLAGEFAGVLAQTALYVVLIGAASMFDLYRKNF